MSDVGIGGAEKHAGENVGLAHHRPVDGDHADAILNTQKRAGLAGLWQSSATIKKRTGGRRHRMQRLGLDQPLTVFQEYRIHAPEAVSTRGSNTRAWNYRRRPSLALPAASGVVPIRPLRVSGSARDIPLVPEPGTAWRQELRRHDLTEGKASLALKGLATRKLMLLFSFDGSYKQLSLVPSVAGFNQCLQHVHHMIGQPLAQNETLALRETLHTLENPFGVGIPFHQNDGRV